MIASRYTYAQQRGGDWGIILPQEAEIAIKAARAVPSFIKLHHFGALRGLDDLKDVRGSIIVGRPMAGPAAVERIAGALSGRAVEAVAGDWYPAEVVQLHARDGSVATVEADCHPDPVAEAVRAWITEGELLQAVGRVRGLNRSGADPVEVVMLTNVPVPGLLIDELRQWEPPSVDDEIFARFGAALESAGDAAAVAGLTLDQVKMRRKRLGSFSYKTFLYGTDPNLCQSVEQQGSPLCQATYQVSGPGRRRQRVVYDPRRIADCRVWLTERLGPLAYFAEDEAVPPAATAPVEPAPPPFQPPVRYCDKITDTTGERIQRCGEPIRDGLDYCEVHRAQYGRTISGPVDARDWVPPIDAAAIPPASGVENWAVWVAAAASGAVNNPAGVLIPHTAGPGEDAWLCAGLGVLSQARLRSELLNLWLTEGVLMAAE